MLLQFLINKIRQKFFNPAAKLLRNKQDFPVGTWYITYSNLQGTGVGGIALKEDMYSFHYYHNRALIKPSRAGDYVFQSVLVCAIVFLAVTAFHMIK